MLLSLIFFINILSVKEQYAIIAILYLKTSKSCFFKNIFFNVVIYELIGFLKLKHVGTSIV